MIPSTNSILSTNLQAISQPSKQHCMISGQNHIVGVCDGVEALKQSIFKILNTERYAYPIYSWNYGITVLDLVGKPVSLVCPEIERRVQDALSVDDRISYVDSFEFDISERGAVAVRFIVHTIYENISEEMEVNY